MSAEPDNRPERGKRKKAKAVPLNANGSPNGFLDTSDRQCLKYHRVPFTFWIEGIGGEQTLYVNMRAQSVLVPDAVFEDHVDLEDYDSSSEYAEEAGKALCCEGKEILDCMHKMSVPLLEYLNNSEAEGYSGVSIELTAEDKKHALRLAKSPTMFEDLAGLFDRAGYKADKQVAMLTYCLLQTAQFTHPANPLLIAKSGTGKSKLLYFLQGIIGDRSVSFDSMSEGAVARFPENFLRHKVLFIHDMDGVEAAQFPLRQLMSDNTFTRITTGVSEEGRIELQYLTVHGPVCVCAATTKSIYQDNYSRSVPIFLNPTKKDLEEIDFYTRRLFGGMVNLQLEQEAMDLLRAYQQILKQYKVVNPYAQYLRLPDSLFPYRTTQIYMTLINAVTLMHQYQRETYTQKSTGNKYLITDLEDIRIANSLIGQALAARCDTLNPAQRDILERIKAILKEEGKKDFHVPTMKRKLNRLHPEKLHRALRAGEQHAILQAKSKNKTKGYVYEVVVWDDYEGIQHSLKELDATFEKLAKVDKGRELDVLG